MSQIAVKTEACEAEVGRMVDSSQADDRKMIRLVRQRRLLYARNNMPVASYYSQVKSLWLEVADQMGWTVADVRRKWSHIRNSYSRHLRNEMHGARTGKGRMVSRWYLADELQFLREHMATDTRPSPYSSYAPSFLEMDLMERQPTPEPADSKPYAHKPWFTLPPQPPHAPYEPHAHNEDSSSSHTFEPEENSSYFQFFRGIYNDYQELPTQKRRLFRRQCLHVLHRLLDEEDGQLITPDVQSDAINLTSSSQDNLSEDEDSKLCILDKVHECQVAQPPDAGQL